MTASPPAAEAEPADEPPPRPAVASPHRVEVGAGLRGPEVWNAYRASVASLFEISLPEDGDPAGFSARSVVWQGVHASLLHSWGEAQVMRRGPEQIARGVDQILLYAQIQGHVDYRAGGHAGRIGPGDVVIYDYTRPFASAASAYENVSLLLARDAAPLALLNPQAHGLHLRAGSGIADLLVAGMAALEASAGRLSTGAFETAVAALASVAAEPVRVQIERDEAERAASSAAARLRARAAAYIDAHLADRTLCPKSVGAHLDLSRSALYRLFEPHGGVRLFILGRRLDRAAQMLLDDPDSHRALAEVARRHGFPTVAHFSRRFSERFGTPPSEYCVLVRAGGTEWLAAQLERTRLVSDLSTAWRDLGARRIPG